MPHSAPAPLPIIPQPLEISGSTQRTIDAAPLLAGGLNVASAALAAWDTDAAYVLALVQARLALAGAPELELAGESGRIQIRNTQAFATTPLGYQAYELAISPTAITISAGGLAGVGNAVATLAQLLTPKFVNAGGVTPDLLGDDDATPAISPVARWRLLPEVVITDSPRYGWRGLSLDVVRRFFPLPELHHIVDLLASAKLNILHVHLTDDQGWRLEVPQRPELTTIASTYAAYDRPGGYYTTAQLQELGRYAALRGVGIVPEVDLPGHTNAALHAIANLNPDGIAKKPYHGIEVGFSFLDPKLAQTYPFIDDVVAAACAVSTTGYVHVGGDEVMKLSHAQFAQIVEYACAQVQAHGCQPVVWQEGIRGDLPAGTHVQYWNPVDGTGEIADRLTPDLRLIASPADRAYVDMKPHEEFPVGLTWMGTVDLQKSYEWDPATLFNPGLAEQIEGVEATMWGETLVNYADFAALAFPRLYAIAEVAWTAPKARDFAAFTARLQQGS